MRGFCMRRRRGDALWAAAGARERLDRFTTASWCRSAMISSCSEARERTMNWSEWSSEEDGRHEWGLSKNACNLNRCNAYGIFVSHREEVEQSLRRSVMLTARRPYCFLSSRRMATHTLTRVLAALRAIPIPSNLAPHGDTSGQQTHPFIRPSLAR